MLHAVWYEDQGIQLLKFSMSQEVKKGPLAALTFESSKNFILTYFQKLMWFYLLATKDSLLGKVWGKTDFRRTRSEYLFYYIRIHGEDIEKKGFFSFIPPTITKFSGANYVHVIRKYITKDIRVLLKWPIKARLQRYPLVLFEQLLKPNYFVIPSTDAAPQFPLKFTPFTLLKFSSLIVIAEY